MHKSVKTLARLSFSPAEVGEQERAKTCQVFCTVITMLAGALLGTTCLFLNPFAWDYDLKTVFERFADIIGADFA